MIDSRSDDAWKIVVERTEFQVSLADVHDNKRLSLLSVQANRGRSVSVLFADGRSLLHLWFLCLPLSSRVCRHLITLSSLPV
jgi:hypothetical protein